MLAGVALALVGCGGTPAGPGASAKPAPTAAPAAALPPGVIAGTLPKGARPLPPEGHLAKITCLSFSPDGRQLLSGSADRSLLIWDVETGQVVQRLLGHEGFISACAFLPDGRRVASGGWEGQVLIWDAVAGGAPLRRLGERAPWEAVSSLSVRADGREVLVGTDEGRVTAWNLETGQKAFEWDDLRGQPNQSTVWATGYLDDGRRFGGGESGSAFIWGQKIPQRIEYKATSGLALPGGRLLLGGWQGLVVAAPDGSKHPLGKHDEWVYGLAFSPRRDLVVAGDDAGHTQVWSIADGSLRCKLLSSTRIWAAAFDPTGEQFAVAGEEAAVLIARAEECKTRDNPVAPRRLSANRGRMRAVAAGPSVLLGDGTGRVSAWSPGDWRLQVSVKAHVGEVTALEGLTDGRWVSGGLDRAVIVSSPTGSRRIGKLTTFPWALKVTEDGVSAITADGAGQLTVLPITGGEAAKRLQVQHELYALALRPGKSEVVTGGRVPELYNVALPPKGKPTRWPMAGQKISSVSALAYSPDGRWLAEVDTHGDIALRDADSGNIERRLTGLHRYVPGLVLTREYLWAGSTDGRLLRWSLTGGPDPDIPPIDEGSPIYGLTATLDARFLIAALNDGRASVRALPSGELIAHLIPLRDGSWATLYANGHFEASQGEALSLLIEDPATRLVATLDGRPLQLRFGDISATLLAEGSTLIRTTVLSPRGRPTVRLDGRWPVKAIIPSRSIALAYDVELLLDDPNTLQHTLEATAPGLEPTRKGFATEPDVRRAPLRPRALVIGNATYKAKGIPPLPGALKDAKAIADALKSPLSWNLQSDQLTLRTDWAGKAMPEAVEAFFRNAAPGETLLFYFAGHGLTKNGEGYLLPTDYDPAAPGPALSGSALWAAINASKAARIVVILDACRAGAFLLPAEAIGRLAEGRRVGFLAATSAVSASADTGEGGPFTQALVKALGRPQSVHPLIKAVTLQKALNYAADKVSDQRPRIFGTLDDLPLGWPAGKEESAQVPIANVAKKSAWITLDGPAKVVTSRQVLLGEARVEGAGADRRLVVPLLFGHDTDSLRVGVYRPYEKRDVPPRPELVREGGKAGTRTAIEVPLRGLDPAAYRVEIEPCPPGGVCGDAAPVEFRLDLKP